MSLKDGLKVLLLEIDRSDQVEYVTLEYVSHRIWELLLREENNLNLLDSRSHNIESELTNILGRKTIN